MLVICVVCTVPCVNDYQVNISLNESSKAGYSCVLHAATEYYRELHRIITGLHKWGVCG
jgi:hypothetical protein